MNDLERVAVNRVQPIDRNRNIHRPHMSWISLNLIQIEGNPL